MLMSAVGPVSIGGFCQVGATVTNFETYLHVLACVGLGSADHDRAIAGFVSILLIPAILARALTEPD
jgi:hypothetical protein